MLNSIHNIKSQPTVIPQLKLSREIHSLICKIYKKCQGQNVTDLINSINETTNIHLQLNGFKSKMRAILEEKKMLKIIYQFSDEYIPATPFLETEERKYYFLNEFIMIFISSIIG